MQAAGGPEQAKACTLLELNPAAFPEWSDELGQGAERVTPATATSAGASDMV